MSSQQSHSARVRQFTTESGTECPDQPGPMSREQVEFLMRMIISEVVELGQTVMSTDEAMTVVQSAADCDVSEYTQCSNDLVVAADQADALVDIYYYSQNAACKSGINLDSVFDAVHNANMSKRWSDGTFHVRDDGKVVKPPGWTAPDITQVVTRMAEHGSWS